MKLQKELKALITKEMQDMDYKLIPPFEGIEVLDITDYDTEKKKAYFQSLSKLALEKAFEQQMTKMMMSVQNNDIKTKN
jgi:hypothetical protein